MSPVRRATAAFLAFLRLEPAAGLLLFGAAVLAMLLANSPWAAGYQWLMHLPVPLRLGPLDLDKPLIGWVNDGLMVIFFFTIGMEVKLEMTVGQLADFRRALLPAIAAAGGMLVPALIYCGFSWGDAQALRGWAIPTATDIAFSLGLLTLAGRGVPVGLKVFLMALAIYDDLGAIMIIAFFYSAHLKLSLLLIALGALGALAVMNFTRVMRLTPYVLVGLVLWLAVLKSGVHATLAGVALGLFVPIGSTGGPAGGPAGADDAGGSPLRRALSGLNPWVAFGILPVFAFMNSGVSLGAVEPGSLLAPVPLGIMLGLFVGKQIGVFGFSWLAVKTGIARLPDRVTNRQLYGVAVLCGVGFTMSLFIASLAFENPYADLSRLGILLGSLLAGTTGFLVLRLGSRP